MKKNSLSLKDLLSWIPILIAMVTFTTLLVQMVLHNLKKKIKSFAPTSCVSKTSV